MFQCLHFFRRLLLILFVESFDCLESMLSSFVGAFILWVLCFCFLAISFMLFYFFFGFEINCGLNGRFFRFRLGCLGFIFEPSFFILYFFLSFFFLCDMKALVIFLKKKSFI